MPVAPTMPQSDAPEGQYPSPRRRRRSAPSKQPRDAEDEGVTGWQGTEVTQSLGDIPVSSDMDLDKPKKKRGSSKSLKSRVCVCMLSAPGGGGGG